MIKIKTTLSRHDVTPAIRRHMAEALARFMPDYHMNKNSIPYPVEESGDSAYIIDSNNNWWCQLDDDDNRIVTLTFRHAANRPGVELAFATWVLSCRTDWEIIHDLPEQRVSVDVELLVDLPRPYDDRVLSTITFDVPLEKIAVFLAGNRIPGAKVSGCTTSSEVRHHEC